MIFHGCTPGSNKIDINLESPMKCQVKIHADWASLQRTHRSVRRSAAPPPVTARVSAAAERRSSYILSDGPGRLTSGP